MHVRHRLLMLAHELLESQLNACETEQAAQREQLQTLEGRVHALLDQYGDYVCV